MKYILIFFTFILANGQEVQNDSLAQIILKNNTFKKNPFSKEYLLIENFMSVSEDSSVKLELARVKGEKGWGVIDKEGKKIVPLAYDVIHYIKDGFIDAPHLEEGDEEELTQTLHDFYNTKGKLLYQSRFRNYSDNDYVSIEKGYLKIRKIKETGIMDNDGKFIIPATYTDIEQWGDYFFCRNFQKKTTEIFDMKGNPIKTIQSTNFLLISEKKGLVQMADINENVYLLNLKTLQPVTQSYENASFHDYDSENPNFYVELTFRGNKNSYILDNEFKIINPNYPNSHTYQGKFLIQKDLKNRVVNILDTKEQPIAQYSYGDFVTYDFFIPGRLADVEFMKRNGKKFLQYRDKEIWTAKHEYYGERYRMFIDMSNEDEKASTAHPLNVFDSNDGSILFTLPSDEVETGDYIDGKNPIFFINYTDNTSKIFDKKGKLIKKIPYKLDSNSEVLSYRYNNDLFINLIDPKTLKLLLPDKSTNCSPIYLQPVRIFEKNKKFGLISDKGKMIRPNVYTKIDSYIQAAYLPPNSWHELINENEYEILDISTMKTIEKYFTKGVPTYYYNGIIHFGNRAMIDMYGNYFQDPKVKKKPTPRLEE